MDQQNLDMYKTLLTMLDGKVFLQDAFFYHHVPFIYKESIAEYFNNSDWLHYMMLDPEARNSFAKIMSPKDQDQVMDGEDEVQPETNDQVRDSDVVFDDQPVFLGPEREVSIPTVIESDSEQESEPTNDSNCEPQSYDELIEFRHTMTTFLNILCFTYIGLLFSYLIFN
jgi:hypothetical protein